MGRPKKVVVENVKKSEGLEPVKVAEIVFEKTEVSKQNISKCQPPHLPKCQCLDILGPGQAYFEDGDTGTVIIGEDTKNDIILRFSQDGKEHTRRINKKRS